MDNRKNDEYVSSPELYLTPPPTPQLTACPDEPNGLPTPGFMDLMEYAQQSPTKAEEADGLFQKRKQFQREEGELSPQEQHHKSEPQCWNTPQSPEIPSDVPTAGQEDHKTEHDQQSELEPGEIDELMRQRQEIERLAQEAEQIVADTRTWLSPLSPPPYENQDLQDRISRCLVQLEEARRNIQYYTQRLEARLQEHQNDERHQRLRRRLRRRQQRRQARQITSHLRESGIDLGLGINIDGLSESTSESAPKIHPNFKDKIAHLARKLHPLVSYSTGRTHPYFPKSILAFNLLTSAQLDALALHFHQVYPPRRESFRYPLPVKPWLTTNGFVRDLGVDTEVKRRRFGRFIGLRGCESPVKAESEEGKAAREESVIEQVERDWERRHMVAKAVEERRRNAPGRYMFMDGMEDV
ncbi:uncharacterized protein DSM5745_05285 [Aspergillus mulundensis]|uniref:Uncharacterized protein n=1 Tax=Aspergillus mulundensis TaxID=1810919 RepID=A0A3D8S628_9EURO|nr:Uncharacterized protein DSM5745_05285 [Aspergillus mulundensis]RDW81728.1 Uncharacterized protein DSM5745_05285 [Aspergillus mulundensis]